MKKITALLLIVLLCCVMLAGCNTSSSEDLKQDLIVYSISGENEYLAISNGVIVLSPAEEIFYGGDLTAKAEMFSDIASYSTTFYLLSDNGNKVLLSNTVEDTEGGTVTVSGQTGKISGGKGMRTDIENMENNLYFELKTTDLNGNENIHQFPLSLVEVTEE